MLTCSAWCLIKSVQMYRVGNPLRGKGYGRNYTKSFKRYAFGGWGMGVYSVRKDRRFMPKVAFGDPSWPSNDSAPFSRTTKSLSPHWRAFALKDGGVFFSHPSHKQTMLWGQDSMKKEQAKLGLTGMDQQINSRMQAIIAENTIENVSLSQWRRAQINSMIRKDGKLDRNYGKPAFVVSLESTMLKG